MIFKIIVDPSKIAIQLPSVITMYITDISEELANVILSYLVSRWKYMSVALVCSKFHLWTEYHKKVVLTTSHEFADVLRQLEEKKRRLEHALLRGDCLKCYDLSKYSDKMMLSCENCYSSEYHCFCKYKDCAMCRKSVCQRRRMECDMCGNCFCMDDCGDCISNCANGDLGLCKRNARMNYRTRMEYNLRLWPYVCTLCVERHGPLCSMCSVGNIVTSEYIAELKRECEKREAIEIELEIELKLEGVPIIESTESSTWTKTLQKFQAKKRNEVAMAEFLEQEKQLLREEESPVACVVYPEQTRRRIHGGQRKRLSKGARRKLERMLM